MADGCLAGTAGLLSGAFLGCGFSHWRQRHREAEAEKRQDAAEQHQCSAPAFPTIERQPSASSSSRLPNHITRQMSGDLATLSATSESLTCDTSATPIKKIYGLGGFCTYNRVLLCLVGLPARGKSYIANMLTRYLRWTGFPCKSFNAGNVRRQEGLAGADANFFRSDDKEALSRREHIASQCMEEALSWLEIQDDVCVAIFDATNTTKKRRQKISERCRELPGITPVFVESICDDPEVLEANYRMKLGNDDYKAMDPVKAREDFLQRVLMYEGRYETIEDDEDDCAIRYIKLFNVGQKVILRHCDGYAPSHIGFYLSNVHITPRHIFLSQHALTKDQEKGTLGSYAGRLTRQGQQYSRELAMYIHRTVKAMEEGYGQKVLVLMGTSPVHKATYDALSGGTGGGSLMVSGDEESEATDAAKGYPIMSTSLLNELDGGDCNGLSYDQIKADFPKVWAAREADKLNFRYPGAGGESYVDVINRLRPVIVELERHRSSILVISHLAVQRCIFAYFTGTTQDELPYKKLDMHTVYDMRPGPFGTAVESVSLAESTSLGRQQTHGVVGHAAFPTVRRSQ